jgi:hypothetical protein
MQNRQHTIVKTQRTMKSSLFPATFSPVKKKEEEATKQQQEKKGSCEKLFTFY